MRLEVHRVTYIKLNIRGAAVTEIHQYLIVYTSALVIYDESGASSAAYHNCQTRT